MSVDRRKRQLKILELISARPIRTQEELAEALAAEGWPVTQSSVSRDISALKRVRFVMKGGKVFKFQPSSGNGIGRLH